MCQTIIELGKLRLEFGLTALIKIGKKYFYVICRKNENGIWSFGKTSGKIIAFYNAVTIQEKPEKHIKITVKDRNGPLKPFTKNGVKKFSSRNVIIVKVENLRSETADIFKVFRTDNGKGKELHINQDYKSYTGSLEWGIFPEKLSAALSSR